MRKRYHLLDQLRGLTLVSMILYHGMWDLVHMFGHSIPWYDETPGFLWQQSICWTFILLSGFCWHFGRKKLRRGLLVLGSSVLITLVTLVFMPESRILFGVLSLLGSATVLLIPMDKALRKLPAPLGLAVSFLLFLLTRNINSRYLGFAGFALPLPGALYRNLFTAYLGFPPLSFYSSDYFPLLPWLFLFLTGYFLHGTTKKLPERLPQTKPGVLAWMGRHSLILYLLHQPVLYGVLYLIHSI